MSIDDMEPSDIFDPAVRQDVLCLSGEFPEKSLEDCYFWYLYHGSDYHDTRSRLLDGFPEDDPECTIVLADSKPHSNNVSVGVFPVEIWHVISSHLAFKDLSSLRITNSVLADIAAESMLHTVRFNSSFDSLERLCFIAGHEHLRKNVRSLTFEAGLLATLGCIHHYSAHYDEDHHESTKPQPPRGDHCTPQAQRLYARNLAKFKKEIDAKYATYRSAFEAQERLINGPKHIFFNCIDKFPNIDNITLITNQCQHLLSQRFLDHYGQDCAVPMSTDRSNTPWQLQHILRPGIRNLTASQLSPAFFNGQSGRTRVWLRSVFQGLESLRLLIEPTGSIHELDATPSLQMATLSYAIGTATNLKSLNVNFTTLLSVGQLTNIIPEGTVFPQLVELGISCFTTTNNDLMDLLNSQPLLETLELGDVNLSTGNWCELFKRIRKGLHLKSVYTGGMLSDSSIILDIHHCCVDDWLDGELWPLSSAIDLYITHSDAILRDFPNEDDFEANWNPAVMVALGCYMAYDELVEEFGPIDHSDLDDELDNSDLDDEDKSESDGGSMHTANEVTSDHGDGNKDVHADDVDDDHQSDFELSDTEDAPPSPMSVD